MQISSTQNQKIKQLIKLQQKSRERKEKDLFVVEGIQENRLALENNFEATQFFVYEEVFKNEIQLPEKEIITLTKDVFEKIAYRATTGGIVGVYKSKKYVLNDLDVTKNLLLIVLESVEKPGNLGAILRTSDAVAADAVVVCDSLVDFYNPNVIRSSVGTVFTCQLIASEKTDFVTFCKENGIQILATYLRENTQNIYDLNIEKSTAFVFGTEATGLTDFWAENANSTIKIPMLGQVDSLNVSNAVAVCAYEAVRQRN